MPFKPKKVAVKQPLLQKANERAALSVLKPKSGGQDRITPRPIVSYLRPARTVPFFKKVKCDAYDKLILQNKNDAIEFMQSQYGAGFVVNGTFMKGLTKLLSRAYCPPRPPHGSQEHRDTFCKGLTPDEHGSIVDKEMELLINCYHCDTNKLPTADPCTFRLMNYLKEKKWCPVKSQFPIFTKKHGFATAIDFLCTDEQGRLIVVELKSSHHDNKRSYEYGHGLFYCSPFNKMTEFKRSWKNFHLLQVLATKLCLERTYGCYAHKYVLVRIGSQQIWDFELPKEIITREAMTEFGKRILRASKSN